MTHDTKVKIVGGFIILVVCGFIVLATPALNQIRQHNLAAEQDQSGNDRLVIGWLFRGLWKR